MKLLNEKVLIKLDEHKEHTSTPTDLLVPLYDNIETDGGRPGVKISPKKYLSQGTVVDISKSAATLLQKDGITLTPGMRVFVIIYCHCVKCRSVFYIFDDSCTA